ncbi:cobyrinate a,c-diamide synthase [Ilyobacter sp.]|uniref:cobyrinate a,c-diamide synthase n=1 Tax=Ilyobacter sp. TaxID=3100343 RepID=UPI0035621014
MKRLLIAGTNSGVGKTTISTAIMAAFDKVAPFKVGPDYIDPRFHEFVTENPSYNLDVFMCGEEAVKKIFIEGSSKGAISIIEGVMGMYDGKNHDLDNGSSGHMARILKTPVILVINAKGASTSLAAMVLGYKHLDPRVKIGGVILNNVSSEKLYDLLKEGIERYTGVRCLGYFPPNPEVELGSRHLGLRQAEEIDDLKNKLAVLKEMAEKYLDLDGILEVAETDEVLESSYELDEIKDSFKGLKVAIAKDTAFSFYYRSNIELMEYAGMEITGFSPLNNEEVPKDSDFVYLGGGYPENFGELLEKNKKTKESIKDAHKRGIPIYGECGGFMYLAEGIKDKDGSYHKMCGLIDVDVEMKNRLNIGRFGYINFETTDGISGKAHEFHYSDISRVGDEKCYFDISKENGRKWQCGFTKDNLLAGYPHIHFWGNMEFFKKLFERGRR